MSKIEFICTVCGKRLLLQSDVYKKAYEGHDKCLDCRGKGKTA